MSEYILAYDFGTSGVKAALVDFEGTLLGYEEEGYPLISEAVGYAEQDPDQYWDAVCKATKAVLAKVGVPGEEVVGMSFGTQGMGIIPVDEDGNVLYNNITWVDSRAREQADRMNAKAGENIIDASDVLPKIMWHKQYRPEVYDKAKYILGCTGYLNMKATGKMTTDYTDGQGLYANDEAVEKMFYGMYDLAELDTAKVPPLIPTGGYVGNLTEQAAEELGVTTKVEVYMGAVDVTVAAVGAACCKEGDVHLYLGTSGWITAMIGPHYLANTCTGIYQLPGLDINNLIYGGCVQSACLAFNWTIDNFYRKEKEELGGGVFDLIEKDLENIPPGSNGIIASPWLMGERCPIMDEKTKGVFIGVSNLTDRADLVNAMQESIGYSLRMQMDYYKNDTGKWPEKIGSIGGGSLSDHWMQMMADIMGTPVYRPANCRHSGAIGAAAIVAVGMGRVGVNEVDQFVQVERTFEPDPERVAIYNEKYETWKKLYPALKDLFAEMADQQ